MRIVIIYFDDHAELVMYDYTSSPSGPSSAESSRHRAGDHVAVRAATPRINSGRLLSGGNELVIEHAGQEYRLRLTRNDKLILTK